MQNVTKKIGLSITSLVLALSLTAPAFAGTMETTPTAAYPSTLSVTGDGKVQVTADKAQIMISIDSQETTGRLARLKNNQALADIKTTLAPFGIQPADIHLDYTSGYPNYDFNEKNIRKISSYNSTYTVSVFVKDLNKVEEITDKVSELEGISIQNTSYLLENIDTATDQAREKAAAQAEQKAQKLAKLYHVNLGRVTSVYETSFSNGPYPSAAIGGVGNTNSVEVSVSLSVSYEISK